MSNIINELIAKIISEVKKHENETELGDTLAKMLDGYTITAKADIAIDGIDRHIKQFISAKRIDGLSPSSLGNYWYSLRRFRNFVHGSCGDITGSIGVDNIRDFIVHLQDQSLKDKTLVRYISTLNSFFDWLHIEEIIYKNPMKKIKSMKIDKNKIREGLTPAEMARLRNACETYREKAIVQFFVSSGCRLSEALSINISDINFNDRSVKIIGKGKKERMLYFSHDAQLMIELYLMERKGDSKALFCSTVAPHGRSCAGAIQHTLKHLGIRAGLENKLHPHLLRHTFAQGALDKKIDITILQELLGHGDLTSTQLYAKQNRKAVKNEYDVFLAA